MDRARVYARTPRLTRTSMGEVILQFLKFDFIRSFRLLRPFFTGQASLVVLVDREWEAYPIVVFLKASFGFPSLQVPGRMVMHILGNPGGQGVRHQSDGPSDSVIVDDFSLYILLHEVLIEPRSGPWSSG